MQQLIQQLINGAALGGLYALTAIGYSLVYGVMELVNFSHGAVYMLGAYVFYIPSPATGGFIPTTRSGPTKAKAVSGFNSPETALNFLFKFNSLIYRISAA